MIRRLDNSTPTKMLQFFAANPDEELTAKDAAVKFDVTVRAVWSATDRLRRSGEVEALYVIRKKVAR